MGDDERLSIFVSTHSRTEAAAYNFLLKNEIALVSTHSRTEAAAPYIKK